MTKLYICNALKHTQKVKLKIENTTLLPEIRIDTVIHVNKLRDTVTITKEKLTVRIHQVLDTVYIEAEREADTVIIEKEIPVDRIVYQTKDKNKIQSFDDLLDRKWFWVVVGGVLLCLILWLFK
ncbi:MAG: hypothetical protein PHW82_14880 [Bacteroidales bacterium]|nr:hypothetical protein [Bacteroidales bacterium]